MRILNILMVVMVSAAFLFSMPSNASAGDKEDRILKHLFNKTMDRVAPEHFTERDRKIINEYYAEEKKKKEKKTKKKHNNKYHKSQGKHGRSKHKKTPPGLAKKSGLPPGLAKKSELPPGLKKKAVLPPGLERKHLPRDLRKRLSPLSDRYKYEIVNQEVILIEKATDLVVDIIVDALK